MGLKQGTSKWMTGAVLLALAGACSRSGEPSKEPGYPTVGHPAAPAPGRAVVAVPALLGLSVDKLPRHLGPALLPPATVQATLSQLPATDPADSTRFFQFRSLSVLASFDPATRRLQDLLLLGPDEDQLMQQAGLSAEASNYLVLPVFHYRRPTQLLGLRVVPLDPLPLQ